MDAAVLVILSIRYFYELLLLRQFLALYKSSTGNLSRPCSAQQAHEGADGQVCASPQGDPSPELPPVVRQPLLGVAQHCGRSGWPERQQDEREDDQRELDGGEEEHRHDLCLC